MKIHDIQGNGDSSPHVGKLVSVEAVVIGEFIIPLSCSSSKSKLQLCFVLILYVLTERTNVLSLSLNFIGDFQDGDADEKRNLNGFFLQEEDSDADSDPLTSEGIYVYDPNTIKDVNVGDLVRS